MSDPNDESIDVPLEGGFANPGTVVRVGDTVRRPPSPFRDAITALLDHVAGTGRVEVPQPLGLDDEGREMFSFVEGDVPIQPYPEWALTDASLRSVGLLLRRFHEAVRSFSLQGHRWSRELSDPRGGRTICHNDVCLENVVFRDGEAIGLLDFEFAAPGRPLYDVAMTLRLCGPVRDPSNVTEFKEPDGISRLAVFCDAYGVRSRDADELIDAFVAGCRAGRRFVEGRARSGQEPFKRLWRTQGAARFERDEKWILQRASEITDALR